MTELVQVHTYLIFDTYFVPLKLHYLYSKMKFPLGNIPTRWKSDDNMLNSEIGQNGNEANNQKVRRTGSSFLRGKKNTWV